MHMGGQWQPKEPGYRAREGAVYQQLIKTPAAETPRTPAAEPAPLLSLCVAARWLKQAPLQPGAEG
ncbi:DNA mismatch repair protein MutL, partial [Pantoea dispersa]|nr:DNA mismatch repair protein MutL [Pantoea dispersa]